MQAKMNVCVAITPKCKSRELYVRLQAYKANVTDLGDKVYVYTQIDPAEDTIDKILEICYEYGDCLVNAHATTDSPSE